MDQIDKTEDPSDSDQSALVSQFPTGHVVVGKYRIVSVLGKGGMGTVYRVQQIFLNRDYALKTMDAHAVSETTLQRFQLEAAAASSLSHPNLVQVHDFGLLDDDKPYLVMDFVDGITFADLLKRDGPLSLANVAPLFSQACFGLLAAHEKGIVHRDVKPSNIMLLNELQNGAEGSLKVVDFGIAKLVTRESGEIQALTRTGEIFGSPLYMSPEQCTGGKVDHRSDIYSLGCVLFEMLTGTPPHMGANALATMMLHDSGTVPTLKEASLGMDYPEQLEQIVAKMLRKNPEHRYQNIGVVAHDLASVGKDSVSRGSVSSGSVNVPVAKVAQKKSPKSAQTVSLSVNQLSLLLIATTVVSIAIGYFIREFKTSEHKRPSLKQAETPSDTKQDLQGERKSEDESMDTNPKIQDDVKAMQSAASAQNDSPAQCTIVDINGKKFRGFKFPPKKIGEIYDYANFATNQSRCQADNEQFVPLDQPLALMLGGKDFGATMALQNPNLFSQLQSANFRGLFIVGPGIHIDLPKLLKIASQWKTLEFVSLKKIEKCDDAFPSLNNLKHMPYFQLIECGVSNPSVVDQPFLNRIVHLNLINTDDLLTRKILAKLKTSKVIESIRLANNPINADDLMALRTCRSLVYLEINQKDITDDLLNAAASIKSLRTLALIASKINPNQQTLLMHSKTLHEIILSKSLYSLAERYSFQKEDPRFKFI